jgi:SPP1 gp7 family putative phage head morphogenesis protein
MATAQTLELRQQLAPLVEQATDRLRAAAVVADLRRVQVPLVNKMEATVSAQYKLLGEHVARAAAPVVADRMVAEAALPTKMNTAEVANMVEHILTASRLREWAGDRFTERFWHHYDEVQNTTGRVLINHGLATNLTQGTIKRILEAGGRRLGLVDIVGDTRSAVFRVLEQGIDGGLGPRDMARLFRDIIPEGRFVNAGSRYRAQLIARTETLHAQRMASLERYRANRIHMVMMFDGESDEYCASRDGEIVTVDDAWGEMTNSHPNCVLAFGPIGGLP